VLIVQQVNKGIIKDLNFHINYGELAYLHSKNTRVIDELLKLLVGITAPESGIISWLHSREKPGCPDCDIGIVFKENILIPDRTLLENLYYVMGIKMLDMNYSQTRLKRILNVVDLLYCRKKRLQELLPHQQVRANIAQAILNYPSTIILNEPTYQLDQVNTQAIFSLLRELNKLSMTIILLSTKSLFGNKEIRFININQCLDSRKKGFYA